VSIEDTDGSEATTSFDVTIDDDMPVASDYDHATAITEGSDATVLATDAADALGISAGADGLEGTLSDITFTNQGTTGGSLSIDADGQLVYTAPTSVDNTDGAVTETFTYTVVDQDGDSVTRQVTVDVSDAGPPTLTASTDLLADEDDLATIGNADSAAGDDAPALTGSLTFDNDTSLDAFDLDTLTLSVDGGTGLTTLAGDAVTATWNATTNQLIGHTGTDATITANQVFVIDVTNVTQDGADYALTLLQPVTHPGQDDPATTDVTETAFEDNVDFTVGVSIEDTDGSEATTSFDVTIDDDMPVAFSTNSADLVDGYTATLNFAAAAGADGVGDVYFAQSLDGEPAVDSTGQSLFLDGEQLFYTVGADGRTLTAATEAGDTGFVITLDPVSDSYSIQVDGIVLNGTLFEANIIDDDVSGSNVPLYLINTADGVEGNDVMVSSSLGETVNTSSGSIGVGTAQSISDDDLVRFDFLSGLQEGSTDDDAVWDARLSVYGFEQLVKITGSPQAQAAFDIYAISSAGASSGEHPSSADNDTYLNLSVDDIRVFNASGGDVTSSVTITDQGDGVRVEGVQSGWSYEVSTDQPFQAIEIVGGGGDDFKLGDMDFRTSGTATSFDINLDIVAEDGDGDAISGSITLESPEPPLLEIGGNIVNTLSGNAGDDVIIGDTGGTYTVITPGESYNISLIVDSSGSMGDPSGTDGKSRMELAQDALKVLAQQLVDHDGVINLQIIDFDTGATETVFMNISGDDLADIETAIDAMVAEGGTNYEAGFNVATAWLDSQENGYINKAFFLTDGDPTYYIDDNSNRQGPGNYTTFEVMRDSIEAFDFLANAGSNGTQVEAIGIGSGVSADRLQFFDNTDVVGQEVYGSTATAPSGEETIVNTADQLNAALQGGSSADELAPVGNDTLSGGDGDDILFGDTITPVGEPEAGLAGVIEMIKVDNGGVEPSDQQIIDYLRANPDSYETPEGQGGDDTLIGGAGNDILFGGEGADTFVWNLADRGTADEPAEDVVMDFSASDGDVLDLSDLLSDMPTGSLDAAYIQAEETGDGVLLHISSEGTLSVSDGDIIGADQTILLSGVDMGGLSASDYLNSLIISDQLDIE
uniref:VWA domain-containing protein n=1 Tax=Halomonas alimentaria TaxID=147248 RepID=UPI0024930C53